MANYVVIVEKITRPEETVPPCPILSCHVIVPRSAPLVHLHRTFSPHPFNLCHQKVGGARLHSTELSPEGNEAGPSSPQVFQHLL